MYSKISSAVWSQNYIEVTQYFLLEMNKRLQSYLQSTNKITIQPKTSDTQGILDTEINVVACNLF